MCGRFTLHAEDITLHREMAVENARIKLSPRYNIAPTQLVAAVVQEAQGRTIDAFRWGLVPFWAKDLKIGNHMINARAETIASKPSFKAALKRRRCLIPASGYYEWQKTDDGKVPHYLHMLDGRPFAMAGLWEEWTSPEEEIVCSCTIITTEANDFAAAIHHRMPVVLDATAQSAWLDPDCDDPAQLTPLLVPCAADAMAAHPVSTRVNVATCEDPACIEPAG